MVTPIPYHRLMPRALTECTSQTDPPADVSFYNDCLHPCVDLISHTSCTEPHAVQPLDPLSTHMLQHCSTVLWPSSQQSEVGIQIMKPDPFFELLKQYSKWRNTISKMSADNIYTLPHLSCHISMKKYCHQQEYGLTISVWIWFATVTKKREKKSYFLCLYFKIYFSILIKSCHVHKSMITVQRQIHSDNV